MRESLSVRVMAVEAQARGVWGDGEQHGGCAAEAVASLHACMANP